MALLVNILAACATSGKTSTPQVGDLTRLTFTCPTDDKMIYQAAADAFHDAYPNLTVKIVPVERSTPVDQLASRADAFVCYESCVESGPAGLLLDLTLFLQNQQSIQEPDFLSGLVERFRWQGGLWGIPAGVDPLVVFYDRAAFDEAGVTYPTVDWTWDDLRNRARLLTRREEEQIARYGFADPLGCGVESVIEAWGVEIVDASVEPPRPMLDNPRAVTAVQWYTDLALTHGVMLNPVQRAGQPPPLSLLQGEAAMVAGLASWWPEAATSHPSVSVAPLPGKTPLMNVYGYFISAGATHPEATWCWLQFLSRKVTPPDLLPARRSLIPQSVYAAADEGTLAVFQYAVEHALPPIRPVMARAWLSQALDRIFAGEDVETALSIAQQKTLTPAAPALASPVPPVPTPMPPGRDIIMFLTIWNHAMYETLADAFHESHPEIEVVVRGAEEFSDQITTQSPAALIAASHADCILASNWVTEETLDAVLNLQPLIEADIAFPITDYDPQILEQVRRRNDIWAIPAQVMVNVLYYNEDVFDGAGLSYPTAGWTWDDWLATARALSGGEEPEHRYGTVLWPGPGLASQLEAMAGTLVDNPACPTGFRFNAPEVVVATQQLADLIADGVSPTLTEGETWDELFTSNYELIHSGRVGMWVQSSMSVGMEWAKYLKRSIGVAPLPKGVRPVTSRSVTAYYIAADTPYITACWDWIKFASGHIPQDGLPARRSLVMSGEFREYVGEEAQVAYLESLAYQPSQVFHDLEGLPGSWEAYTWLVQAVQEILWRGADAQITLDQAQQKAEAYLDCLHQCPDPKSTACADACFERVDVP